MGNREITARIAAEEALRRVGEDHHRLGILLATLRNAIASMKTCDRLQSLKISASSLGEWHTTATTRLLAFLAREFSARFILAYELQQTLIEQTVRSRTASCTFTEKLLTYPGNSRSICPITYAK